MGKFHFIIICLLLGLGVSNAQAYELGLNIGGGNYIGDIGPEYYFNPNKIGFGGVFKRTINPWFSVRVNLNYFQINADDTKAESLGRRSRKFYSQGNVFNFSSGFEYNFVPRNPFLPLSSLHRITPYFFTGIGIATYYGEFERKILRVDDRNRKHVYSGTNLNIPLIIGVKFKAARHFIISLESGAYYFLTDNLDGTAANFHRIKHNPNLIYSTTNLNSNDWYTFSSIGLIFTFGELDCYFDVF